MAHVIPFRDNFVSIELEDNISSNLSYYGYALDSAADTADPVWRISRRTRSGSLTRLDTLDNGEFTQVWDDRTTLFAGVSYVNTYSLFFDGIDDSVQFGNNLQLNTGQQWSISLWFKADNLAARRTLYAKCSADSNVYGLGIYLETSGKIFIQTRAPAKLAAFTSSASFSSGIWNNLVITYTGSGNQTGYRLYFNGAVDSTPGSSSLGDITVSEYARIGTRNGSFPFSGYIEEVGFWNKNLNNSEVSEIYNAAAPLLLLDHSSAGNLTNYYRMGDGDVLPTIFDNKASINGTAEGPTIAAEVP